ncbi:MAG: tetratricopeptide repeat protein [Deltaproteobacteria bacterium]|nr:tetratricopeptide repeat protein [Deltaproteobacteria bacterium]
MFNKLTLGFAYSEKGLLEEALSEYLTAVAINPNCGRSHYNLAAGYYRKGEYAMAILHCDKARELGYAVCEDFLELLQPYRSKAVR